MATITKGVNSYVSEAEATEYATNLGYTFTGDLSVALFQGMRYLNLQNWSGSKTDENQDLDFPRNGDTEVPVKIEWAQIELAMLYDQGTVLLGVQERKIKSEKIDVIETVYADDSSASESLTPVNILIGGYLSTGSTGGGFTFNYNLGYQ